MTWDFNERLAASERPEVDARAKTVLREYFGAPPDFDYSTENRGPYRQDADVLAHGIAYKIEIKARGKDYGDELIEDVSNDRTGRPGWTWRASEAAYVLHLYPTSRWEIFPGAALEKAWRANRDQWAKCYGIRPAPNRGYRTLNVPVPTAALKSAVSKFDAPICHHCGRNVGVFRSVCRNCGAVSCCAVSDGSWVCKRCAV